MTHVGRCVGGGVGLCVRDSHFVPKKHTTKQGRTDEFNEALNSIPPPPPTILPGLTLTHGAFSCSGTVLFANGIGIVKTDSTKPMIYCLRADEDE
jgi:hypothetical protein